MEEQRVSKQSNKRFIKWLFFIVLMGCLRSFLMNFVQVNNDRVPISPGYLVKTIQYQSDILGWGVFGNIADNAFDPKNVLVFAELFLSVSFFFGGLILYELIDNNRVKLDTKVIRSVMFEQKFAAMFVYAAINAVTFL